jgi:hypothetical protein
MKTRTTARVTDMLTVPRSQEADLPTAPVPDDVQAAQSWDSLFSWGDEFRKKTGVTKDEIHATVNAVRSCKS